MKARARTEQFSFIDLFAGLGGFHLALEALGGECVFAAEWKPHLQDLYEFNFGIRPAGDIRKIKANNVPNHDVLAAGFPCQPFSKAGDQRGFECTEQGDLFFNVAAIIRKKKPKYIILENVPNLLKHDNGRTWERIQQMLGRGPKGLGYYIDAKQFSPHNFGIPQIRDRVYIVGSTEPMDGFKWPDTSNAETSIDTVLDRNPPDAKQLSERVTGCLNVWNDFLHRSPKNVELPSFPLWSMEWGATYPFESETPYALKKKLGMDGLKGFKGSHGCPIGYFRTLEERWLALPSHARTEAEEFPKWKKDFIRQNRSFYEANKTWIDPWQESVLQFPSSLQKFEWNVKGGHRDIWQYVIQFRASGVRVKRRTTAPSLIAMTETQVPIIAWEKRYMTPRECARLQSLERLKQLPENNNRAFEALGNAVNAEVVQLIAGCLVRSDREKLVVVPVRKDHRRPGSTEGLKYATA